MNTPIASWRGLRVWLIGASSGIGAALAQQLMAAGAIVSLSARRELPLQQVASASGQAHVMAFDATDSAAWPRAYQTVCSKMGEPDLVLFCAADYRPERIWEVSAERAGQTLDINLISAYRAIETILPAMLQRGKGGIGLIASVAGYMGLPNASVYGPSKAALINLAEILYSDLHPKGLDVYLINPGFVRTSLTAKNDFSMPALQTPEQAASAILHGIAAGKFEIHFPRRFTQMLKLTQFLPYRWRFALFERYLKLS
ncbi:SDR family NAD(P)-dependent oxidoreductase [Chitinibacter fontanus]|uniref:SDR family NAD(P)-dependent oxidoreductase n=2 Tax=Chitinibacter fontanus TaxID=1737446 RepID=A0A7D5ZG49_9NEIS|nr:SDR family NAD(P)-dependent oxidoreductase [Chitinibacter fontanus]